MVGIKLWAASILGAGMVAFAAAPSLAQQPRLAGPVLTEQFIGSRLNFSVDPTLSNFTLRVTGPDGYVGEVQSARVAPSFRLADHGSVPNGIYTYELTAATTQQVVLATPAVAGADGRSGRARPGLVGTTMSGTFRVVDGQILPMDSLASER